MNEKTSNSNLISDHKPTTNHFSLSTPTSKTYVASNVINFKVTFPYNIIINTGGGTPRLNLTIGSTTKFATYVAQSNPREIHFSYTVVNGDEDLNGIVVEALELNGSSLKFDNSGTMEDCNVSTISPTSFAGVKIDTSAPTITGFSLENPSALYRNGNPLSFKVTYSEPVLVAGTPKFTITFNTGAAHDVTYVAGNGTSELYFSYTITDTDFDNNGYVFSAAIDVGAGSIKDTTGNVGALGFSGAQISSVTTKSQTVIVAGTYPYVVGMTVPAAGSYASNQPLDFVLEYDRSVTVTGSPYLQLTVGTSPSTSPRQAQYVTGAPSKFVTFRYTTVPGDTDTDGIAMPNLITQNAGNIISTATSQTYFVGVNNAFLTPDTSGIILTATQPQAISVTRNLDTSEAIWGTAIDNKWIIGQELNITVGFNTGIIVGQVSGTPSLPLTIGAATRQATYLSGGNGQTSIVFRYIIQEGDLDTDGSIGVGTMMLNGGTMTDAALTNATLTLPVATITSTIIDGVRPVISTFTLPANNTYSTVASNNHVTMFFLMNWSEPVDYSTTNSGSVILTSDIGGTSTLLQYNSGNRTASIRHRAANLNSRNDLDGITLTSPISGSAVIKDQAGNTVTDFTFLPPDTSGILVDTTPPQVSSVSAITADGTYGTGQEIEFSVTFNESVTTQVAGGYPRIPVTIGAATKYLVPTASSTNTVHTFSYTILASDSDSDGITLGNAITHNGTTAYARDAGRNNSTGTFIAPNTSGIIIDAVAATVSSVTSTASGTYTSGDDLSVAITYTDDISVDTSGGTPRIQVNIGGTNRYMDYATGTGTPTISFTYTLSDSDFDGDGLPAVAAFQPNGGVLTDSLGNIIGNTFTSQNLGSIFVTFPDTSLWVQSNFVSKARVGSPTVSNSGAISTIGCGSGTCRNFNGDDGLNLTSALNGVRTVFIVLRAPAVSGNHELFSTDITLVDDSPNMDITTVSSKLYVEGSYFSISNTNFNANLVPNTTYVLQVDFDGAENFTPGPLINPSFDGAIGEVMVITGPLPGASKDIIRNFLMTKY